MTEVTFGYGSDFLATFGWGWSDAAPPRQYTRRVYAEFTDGGIKADVKLGNL